MQRNEVMIEKIVLDYNVNTSGGTAFVVTTPRVIYHKILSLNIFSPLKICLFS